MKRPRFIAGAVCAQCGAIDRVVVEETDDGQRRRCVACDDIGERSDQAGSAEPRSRLHQEHDAGRSDAESQPVRLIDPRRPKQKPAGKNPQKPVKEFPRRKD